MENEAQTRPSFSPGRKWSTGFNVTVRTLAALAVMLMANYLAGKHFERKSLSAYSRIELSSRTIEFVRSLTNQVNVIIYFDKEDKLYATVAALLKEYQALNPRISVRTVDYLLDAIEAGAIKKKFKLPEAKADDEKNLVIFECEGRSKPVPGKTLADYQIEPNPDAEVTPDGKIPLRMKAIAFNGEMMFTSVLLAITNPRPLKACVLGGHGEHRIDSGDEVSGYLQFKATLLMNYVQVEPIALIGTNNIPLDCNLLIIPGPKELFGPTELEKIQKYLTEGGRLFALFSSSSKYRDTGLESILTNWNVVLSEGAVVDREYSENFPNDLVAVFYGAHPVVGPMVGSGLQMIPPRAVSQIKSDDHSTTDAPKVTRIIFSGEKAQLTSQPKAAPHQYPLAVAVEKGAVKGVITDRGTTRMVIVGDSFFLCNGMIDKYANRDFVGYAVNWLLERPQLLEGVTTGKPMTEYRLALTQTQKKSIRWWLLATLPGSILLLGVVVWWRRHK